MWRLPISGRARSVTRPTPGVLRCIEKIRILKRCQLEDDSGFAASATSESKNTPLAGLRNRHRQVMSHINLRGLMRDNGCRWKGILAYVSGYLAIAERESTSKHSMLVRLAWYKIETVRFHPLVIKLRYPLKHHGGPQLSKLVIPSEKVRSPLQSSTVCHSHPAGSPCLY